MIQRVFATILLLLFSLSGLCAAPSDDEMERVAVELIGGKELIEKRVNDIISRLDAFLAAAKKENADLSSAQIGQVRERAIEAINNHFKSKSLRIEVYKIYNEYLTSDELTQVSRYGALLRARDKAKGEELKLVNDELKVLTKGGVMSKFMSFYPELRKKVEKRGQEMEESYGRELASILAPIEKGANAN